MNIHSKIVKRFTIYTICIFWIFLELPIQKACRKTNLYNGYWHTYLYRNRIWSQRLTRDIDSTFYFQVVGYVIDLYVVSKTSFLVLETTSCICSIIRMTLCHAIQLPTYILVTFFEKIFIQRLKFLVFTLIRSKYIESVQLYICSLTKLFITN